jgi:hypothetical protein
MSKLLCAVLLCALTACGGTPSPSCPPPPVGAGTVPCCGPQLLYPESGATNVPDGNFAMVTAGAASLALTGGASKWPGKRL